MAHCGLDRAVEILKIVGTSGDEAGEREKGGARGALEQSGETLHIDQHSGICRRNRGRRGLAVNTQ